MTTISLSTAKHSDFNECVSFLTELRFSLTKAPKQSECTEFRDTQHISPNDDKSKCREHDCGVLCVNTYKTDHHNQILGMCVHNYNFCQCLTKNAKSYTKHRMQRAHIRSTVTLEIRDDRMCQPTDCTLVCLRNDYDFGICQFDKPVCSCWTSMNFPRGIGLRPSGWFGIVNLEIALRSLRFTDSHRSDAELRYVRRRDIDPSRDIIDISDSDSINEDADDDSGSDSEDANDSMISNGAII